MKKLIILVCLFGVMKGHSQLTPLEPSTNQMIQGTAGSPYFVTPRRLGPWVPGIGTNFGNASSGTNIFYAGNTNLVIGLGGVPNSSWLAAWSVNGFSAIAGGIESGRGWLQMRTNIYQIGGVYSNYNGSTVSTIDGGSLTTVTITTSGDSSFNRGANPMIQMNQSSAKVIGNVNANTSGADFEWRGNGLNNMLATSIDRNRVTIGMDPNTYGNGLGAYVEIFQSGSVSGTNVFRVDQLNNAAIGAEAFAVRTNGTTAINLGLILPTNPAPTSVTLGVTTPDAWFWFTNNGVPFSVPAWKNH